MPKGTATVLLGVMIGIVGVMVYTRLRENQAGEDAQALIDRLTQNLLELESGSGPQGS